MPWYSSSGFASCSALHRRERGVRWRSDPENLVDLHGEAIRGRIGLRTRPVVPQKTHLWILAFVSQLTPLPEIPGVQFARAASRWTPSHLRCAMSFAMSAGYANATIGRRAGLLVGAASVCEAITTAAVERSERSTAARAGIAQTRCPGLGCRSGRIAEACRCGRRSSARPRKQPPASPVVAAGNRRPVRLAQPAAPRRPAVRSVTLRPGRRGAVSAEVARLAGSVGGSL